MPGFFPVGSAPVASSPEGAAGYYSITTLAIQYSGNPFTSDYVFPSNRITWLGAEVLHPGVASARATWIGAEVLHPGVAETRITWIGAEVLRSIETAGGGDSGFISILW